MLWVMYGLYDELGELTMESMRDELSKLAMGPVMKKFIEGAKGEAGPALGATIGAGLAGAAGGNVLSGAALGYGAGSLPEMIMSAKHNKQKLLAQAAGSMGGGGV